MKKEAKTSNFHRHLEGGHCFLLLNPIFASDISLSKIMAQGK